jgi:outer membrane receptor protein involved in Fe transport
MMRFLIVTLSFLFSQVLIAQGPPRMGRSGGQMATGRFYGKVVDAANKGIQAVSVTLVQKKADTVTKEQKDVIVGGMLTSAGGNFSIENIPAAGRYTLKITGIGYKAFEQAVAFQMPNRTGAPTEDPTTAMGALDKDLGNIKLEIDDKVLSSVTVTASKPMVQMGIDRKVFNVEQNLVSAGGTAIDVLKNVPTVSVDIDGNVSLRNSAPQVFVDGRPTNMTLDQIPADAIESIEVITNPSAKFDASGGTAGILNVVLKKAKRVGYSGNVRANVDSRGKVGAGINANMRQNKINLFGMGNYNQRKSISTAKNDRFTTPLDTVNGRLDSLTRTFQRDKNVMEGAFGFGRIGLDYFIDNRNTFTINGSMSRGKMEPENNSDINIDYFDDKRAKFSELYNKRITSSTNNFRNWGTQASYKHNFPKTGHELTADVTYNKGKNENLTNINTQVYTMPGNTFKNSFNTLQSGGGANDNLVIQTDYINPISETSKLELGARLASRTVENRTDYYTLGQGGGLPTQSINFASNDHVYAAYTNFSNRIKNFGYQVGLRVESSEYTGDLLSKGESFKKEFPVSLFPSLFLSQKLGESDDLQFNYSRRINRPGVWQLFPFYDIVDTLNISRGNPDLNPEFTNSFEMSYSKTFKNRDNLLASLYFKNTTDLITRVQNREIVDVYKKELPVLTYENANASYTSGLELTARNKVAKWWELTSNINLFTSKIDLKDQEDPDQLFSYFLRLNNTFKLPKNLSIQLSGDYDSKRLVVSGGGGSGGSGGGGGGRGGGGGGFGGGFGGAQSAAQGYIKPQYGVDAAVRYDFLKDKAASLSLSMNDVFRTKLYRSHTEAIGIVQDIERRRDAQVFRLNFNWRFGKYDNSLFKRKNTRAENEGVDTGAGGGF